MSRGIIRVGLIVNSKQLRTGLIQTFRKYSPRIEVVFEKQVSAAVLSAEELAQKIKTGRISALFISSDFPGASRLIALLKSDVLIHTRIFVVAESENTEEIRAVSAISDYTVFKDSDLFVVCTRVCALCSSVFTDMWEDDRAILSVLAQELLRSVGFNILLYGYVYLAEAMVFCVYNKEYLDCLSALYFAVAHRMKTMSEKTIEKSIRVALDKAHKSYEQERAARLCSGADREISKNRVADAADDDDALCEKLFKNGRPSIGKALPVLSEELLKRFEMRQRGIRKYENYSA